MFLQDATRLLENERRVPSGQFANIKILLAAAERPGMWAVGLHRLAERLDQMHLAFLGRLVSGLNLVLTGCEIHPRTRIGPGFVIHHPQGVVIVRDAKIGRNLRIHTGAVIGVPYNSGPRKKNGLPPCPTLGDDVFVGAGAKVIGLLTVGDGARIGANAVVVRDVPTGATVVGIPAKEIDRRD
jgi:serine O-acetyltransferase